MNVSAAKNTEPGMKIPTLTGKVEEVYQRRVGKSDKGTPWAVQKFKLSEGRDWIFVDCWNHDDLAPYKGHTIKISDDRGIEVKDNSYNDKKTGEFRKGISFSAGKGAVITSPGFGDEGDAPQAQQTAQAQPPPHVPPAAAPIADREIHRGFGPNEPFVKRALNKLANLYMMVEDAADYVGSIKPFNSEEHYQSFCATIFIQATREGLQDHIAVGKYHQAEPQQEPAPAPALTPPPQPAPAFVPPPQPRTPANPGYGDHRDQGHAFDPNESSEDCPF